MFTDSLPREVLSEFLSHPHALIPCNSVAVVAHRISQILRFAGALHLNANDRRMITDGPLPLYVQTFNVHHVTRSTEKHADRASPSQIKGRVMTRLKLRSLVFKKGNKMQSMPCRKMYNFCDMLVSTPYVAPSLPRFEGRFSCSIEFLR